MNMIKSPPILTAPTPEESMLLYISTTTSMPRCPTMKPRSSPEAHRRHTFLVEHPLEFS
jgi:hypothetical protein